MDQVKIGNFISELRKEKGLTQKQLAEGIGVSDKTISKWECGNGLPEMSSIPVLCEALGVNVNELLSGERLDEAVYSEKAEANMMYLMKETEEHKRKNRGTMVTLVLSMIGVLLPCVITILIANFQLAAILDFPTAIMIAVPTVVILLAAGKGKTFLRAFLLLGQKDRGYTKRQYQEAELALKLASDAALLLGVLSSVLTYVFLFGEWDTMITSTYQGLANIAVASLGIVYGLALYLFFLPLRSRLKTRSNELTENL